MKNKKLLCSSIFASSLLVAAVAAAAGVTGTVKTIAYNPMLTYDQVWLNGVTKFCELSDNAYENQARIDRTNAGAAVMMSALLAAKLSGSTVYIEANEAGGRCHIKTVEIR